MSETRWDRAVNLHTLEAAELVKSASAVPEGKWTTPRGEGKWTPAQVLEHLTLAYETLLGELNGGPGMRYRYGPVMRTIFRLTIFPRILRGKPFPRAASPRETRPGEILTKQTDAIARFQNRAADFERAMNEARAKRQRVRLTHAYFGRLGLRDAMTLVARHIAHHRRQITQTG